MSAEWVSCDSCGRDTKNKSRICKRCLPGNRHLMEHATAVTGPLYLYDYELSDDLSEDSLGPRLSENRFGMVFKDDGEEWHRVEK